MFKSDIELLCLLLLIKKRDRLMCDKVNRAMFRAIIKPDKRHDKSKFVISVTWIVLLINRNINWKNGCDKEDKDTLRLT